MTSKATDTEVRLKALKPGVHIIAGCGLLLNSYLKTFFTVAAESAHMVSVPASEKDSLRAYHEGLIQTGQPLFYAVDISPDDVPMVVGWVDIKKHPSPSASHRGYLSVGVLHAYRGQGLGRKLLQTALKAAPTAGIEQIELEAFTTNTPAINLFEGLGFQKVGTLPHYRKNTDDSYSDVTVMYRPV